MPIVFPLTQFKFEILDLLFMQRQNNEEPKKDNKKRLDILDRFLMILWKREVEYKINI